MTTKRISTNLKTSDGRCTRYALACGYCDSHESVAIGDTYRKTRLWSDHGVYHVRCHEFSGRGRLFFHSFHSLQQARLCFDLSARGIRYGFDKNGGFVAIDESRRIGEFAFPTSTHADNAKRNAPKTAAEMIAKTWTEVPAMMREEHYRMSCEAIIVS